MATVSGSIGTEQVDPYRQGIELTADKHFFAGVVKIWSGYTDHIVPQHEFGQSTLYVQSVPFIERRKFDAQDYISHSSQRTMFERLSVDNFARMRDGAIEPFEIRSGSFDFGAIPLRSVKGSIGGGNTNEFGETDVIKQEFVPARSGTVGAFVDSSAIFKRETYRSGRIPKQSIIYPFIDDFPYKKGLAQPASASVAFIVARNAMSGTDLNTLLSNRHRSMTSGFVYDGATNGTDSLAFGGYKW